MSDFTFQDVLDSLRLIDSGSFSEFQLEFEGTKLKVTRRTGTAPAAAKQGTDPISAIVRPAQPAIAVAVSTHDTASQVGDSRAGVLESRSQRLSAKFPNGIDVKPPMSGTYYAAPSPNAAPFVEVDRTVRKGDQVGVVEVMKLFTQVLAPCDGTIRAILVGNEEFVQSDQTLMIIEGAQ